MTSSPSSASSHRTGRANRARCGPHRIVLGKLRRAVISGKRLREHVGGRLPGDLHRRAHVRSLVGLHLAKIARRPARVPSRSPAPPSSGLPSASNAAFQGGPVTSSVRSSCRSGSPRANRTSRRGVACVSIGLRLQALLGEELLAPRRGAAPPREAGTPPGSPRCRSRRPGPSGSRVRAPVPAPAPSPRTSSRRAPAFPSARAHASPASTTSRASPRLAQLGRRERAHEVHGALVHLAILRVDLQAVHLGEESLRVPVVRHGHRAHAVAAASSASSWERASASFAARTASPRTRPMYAARSVGLIAPRESSTLNV